MKNTIFVHRFNHGKITNMAFTSNGSVIYLHIEQSSDLLLLVNQIEMGIGNKNCHEFQ